MSARRTTVVLAGFSLLFSLLLVSRWPAAAQNQLPGHKPAGTDAVPAVRFAGERAGQTRKDNVLRAKLVWIPPGEFTMGSPKDEKGHLPDETQVPVTLTTGFWLGEYEVTQAEWKHVIKTAPWSGTNYVKEGNDYPATHLSWDDAMKFCEKLTETERGARRLPKGWKYTLPTEAQWEYACRAGTKSRFSFGDNDSELGNYAWFEENAWDAGEKYAHLVGQKKPNAFGFYDMHGNQREWCRDWYGDRLAGGTDPQGPSAGSLRVFRGGCLSDDGEQCRSAFRRGRLPDFRANFMGFRVAAVPSGK
ncbi:MAG TPA: formylglycine-generating enzyme family protein [Planctomycetaceae bacterium]|nr:formylglycine-generating enzyme family protein [Planctomycetaceae bacterium]